MIRYHESQRFHGGILALLLASGIVVAIVVIVTVVSSRVLDPVLMALGPIVVVVVALLLSLSHLDVDVDDAGVRIAFRYVWPARTIAFRDITDVAVRHYESLLEYGGWGVRLGLRGWAYTTGGTRGVQLRLRVGLPVLIGSAQPERLETAIREGMARAR